MSVGLEDINDLWNDLLYGLDSAPIIIDRSHRATQFRGDVLPVAVVKSGTVVAFETNDDNYELLSKGAPLRRKDDPEPGVNLETINVVTGPLAIEGAMPGDALQW